MVRRGSKCPIRQASRAVSSTSCSPIATARLRVAAEAAVTDSTASRSRSRWILREGRRPGPADSARPSASSSRSPRRLEAARPRRIDTVTTASDCGVGLARRPRRSPIRASNERGSSCEALDARPTAGTWPGAGVLVRCDILAEPKPERSCGFRLGASTWAGSHADPALWTVRQGPGSKRDCQATPPIELAAHASPDTGW